MLLCEDMEFLPTAKSLSPPAVAPEPAETTSTPMTGLYHRDDDDDDADKGDFAVADAAAISLRLAHTL